MIWLALPFAVLLGCAFWIAWIAARYSAGMDEGTYHGRPDEGHGG